MSNVRHFLDVDRLDTATLRRILDGAVTIKKNRPAYANLLAGKTLALIFEKPSTRTRVSFEVGMRQLGGNVLVLKPDDMQLGRGETIGDTARVLSRYVDAVMVRTTGEERVHELAAHASIPIINGLTDQTHPCQIMADLMTFEEHRGPIEGRVVAWTGDCNNVAVSWAHAAVRFGFEIRLACPPQYAAPPALLAWAKAEGKGRVVVTESPEDAVRGAECVITDAWASMHNTDDVDERTATLAPYQVNEALMGLAHPEALFMHCLPAHRGEEVTDGVIDGRHSVVWDEAENRLHAQKAILAWCMDALV
ncbi:ornithine carbamoyltransferase [Azospirillum doebereinerae]|uniref:Ornithine carbamoyltransferase n=1 Tax=Azospirillum doebereinerae TaxID=92933 RepID=A0A433JFS0_9PROT|nr:ornithine carbamoyltransferase [Azospirillum doebereinerae]MCG5241036.1 ornithine carbamoyltransferase [Azospirillum doebereinerae]RUQ76023.1 ornithine carbamoyltransferase [Azospirillum doebereinerae]